jgi:hypothetical protein
MSKDKRKITRKRFCRLLAAKIGSQVPEVRDFAACCVGFEQYKNQQMRARRKAEQVFGRLCWKDAWEELREVRDR